jgi:hypothetical protein
VLLERAVALPSANDAQDTTALEVAPTLALKHEESALLLKRASAQLLLKHPALAKADIRRSSAATKTISKHNPWLAGLPCRPPTGSLPPATYVTSISRNGGKLVSTFSLQWVHK